MRYAFILILVSFSLWGRTESHAFRLYINDGYFHASEMDSFHYLAFNASPHFTQIQYPVIVTEGDSLKLIIVNNHSQPHTIGFKEFTLGTLLPGDSMSNDLYFESAGNYVLSDEGAGGKFQIMGLSTMLVIRPKSGRHFYWNIEDHSKAINDSIWSGGAFDMSIYYPAYFTINGKSNPYINEDSTARVSGNVGDSIWIHVQNSGSAIHSLHFHGYHVLIMYSSAHPDHKGRSKDTCPVEPQEVLLLLLIPDKPGEYPVHDHNLVAVTGGNIYPNGMFTTMLIK